MNERNKTLAFVGFAALVGVLALVTQPRAIVDKPDAGVGESFFPKFENPLAAKTLEITEFDEDQGALVPFKVTQVNGIWTIPSHSNYPADASKQMADAAACLIDVKKLDVASTNPAEQEIFGVVDPTATNLSAGSRGVGKKVVVQDGGGNLLAQFIIGKADTNQTGVRFVRIPGQDPVYRVEMNIDKLSTKFGDWIEKDLLKLNAFDVRQITMNDYSVDEARGLVEQRALINVKFDAKDNKWQLGSIEVFKDKKGLVPENLGPDQELNGDKLNDLKNALDELQIIDVSRKPAGLSADLRVEDKLAQDRQSKISLAQHGFYVVPLNKQLVLLSNEGEALCGTSEGVEYVLRFGEIAGAEAGEKKDGDKKEEGKKDGDKKAADKPGGVGVSRYIMVTSRFNEGLIPKPELQALPGPQPDKKDAPKDDKKEPPKKEEKPSADKPAAGTKGAEKPPADEEEDDASSKCNAPGDEPAKAAEQPAGGSPPASAPKTEEKPKTEAELERERIEKENKQKQDEYDSKVKEGKKKVTELNGRFADWYYIISDATYQKIHLGRGDVVKKKEAPKDEAGKTGGDADAKDPFQKFKDLKQGGLDK